MKYRIVAATQGILSKFEGLEIWGKERTEVLKEVKKENELSKSTSIFPL